MSEKKIKAGLEQMLEQVTAPSDAEPRDLCPDARELRETWLALGRLLEAAQPAATPPLESVAPPRTPPRRTLTAIAALAASVFLAFTMYWMWGGGGKLGVALPSPDGQAVSVDGPSRPAPATPHPQNALAAEELRWDDSLDDQIATAGQSLALAQSDLSHAFDAADFVRCGIQQTQRELENNKL